MDSDSRVVVNGAPDNDNIAVIIQISFKTISQVCFENDWNRGIFHCFRFHQQFPVIRKTSQETSYHG